MSRGGREGNNAFTKDQQVDLADTSEKPADIMRWNVSQKFIEDLRTKLKLDWKVESSIVEAVR